MKFVKKLVAVLCAVAVIAMCFSGCSNQNAEKYGSNTAIIGYTSEASPFITNVKNGKASGFEADLWEAIFDSVKGDLKNYRFEKVNDGYTLEEDGGFYDSSEREYSACLLFGKVAKDSGTFNKDYSYTEPIISNRVITIVPKGSNIKTYNDIDGAKVGVVGTVAKSALEKNTAIYNRCASVEIITLDESTKTLGTKYDAVVIDELTYCPTDSAKANTYDIIDGELDTIEYVIACAKNSGWKDSINEAIREMKSEKYGDGDEFTPLVEKYFGYNASSFNYQTDGDD